MRIYTAGLIDKPLRTRNSLLRKEIVSDLRKNLHIPKNAVTSQELNTFILVSGETNGSAQITQDQIDKIEKRVLHRRFKQYYNKNEKRLKNFMQKNQELQETSQIVKDFLNEIDSKLSKDFNHKMKKISDSLPQILCELSTKSFIALWQLEESHEYRFYLPGFDFPIFTGNSKEGSMDIATLVDKLLITNFIATFLTPTCIRLKDMHQVLIELDQELNKPHYSTNNKKLNEKFVLFLRILVAKLSALQDLETLLFKIFNLFEVPKIYLAQYKLKSDRFDFNTVLSNMSEEIQNGRTKLREVGTLIQSCQVRIRDYLDTNVNGVKKAETVKEFKEALIPLAKLSQSLFIEAELLKIWADYFGSDIPYFTFNTQMYVDTEAERENMKMLFSHVIIAVRGLFKNYILGNTTVYALRGINLDIREGEFVAIVGTSGSGKTTLLNCMAGLDTPDHGVVYFRGKNLHEMKDSNKSKARLLEMGFIFQSYALLPHYNTRENVALPADLAGFSKEFRERIEQLLKGVGIDQQSKQFPAQLSGGQMQRVAIARALTNRPAVIFADEPTGDLDSQTGQQVMELLKKFHEETNTTIIVITHEDDIAAYAERQIMMKDGVII